MLIAKKDVVIALAVAGFVGLAFGVTYSSWGESALGIAICVAVFLLITILLGQHREQAALFLDVQRQTRQQLEKGVNDAVCNVQALLYLSHYIQTEHPLPRMGDWAVSADFLAQLVSTIRAREPDLIVEVGSGVSTVVAAYCLEKIGKGQIISIDHDKQFAELTRKHLEQHNLSQRAVVLFAPLKTSEIKEQEWLWYDISGLTVPSPIDMLIVDGPPGYTQQLARYPALPFLYNRLNRDAVVLMDDGARPDEKKIVEIWEKEFPELDSQYMPLEKGLYILHRKKPKEGTGETPPPG